MAFGKLKILHLLSQTELTGAETYAVDLASEQKKNGHDLWIMSDKLHTSTDIPLICQPLSKRSYFWRVKNILALRAFIHQNEVDIVHAHSRAASWVAYYATLGTNTGYVSTVHGRQHLHFSSRSHDIYGDRIIAISENIKQHLISELNIKENKITMIPNGLRFASCLSSGVKSKKTRLSILGRTSGPKGIRAALAIKNVLPTLLRENPDLEIVLAGGPIESLDSETVSVVEQLKNEFSSRLHLYGALPHREFLGIIASSHIVFGSGRVAIKSLAMDIPTFAMGESSVPGWIDKNNYSDAVRSNFGDICVRQKDVEFGAEKMLEQVRAGFVRGLPNPGVEELVRKQFDVVQVARLVEREYKLARLKKNVRGWIPVLMYHKVENHPLESKHRIFVSSDRFETHLQFLRKRGFETVTFDDLDMYMNGVLPWKKFPRKPVIITFDDGYESTYFNAVPRLSKFSFRAVFFVMGNVLLQNNSWDMQMGEPEARLMDSSLISKLMDNGHEIGAHTLTHPRLTELSEEQMDLEVAGSRKAIESFTGKAPKSFAYPYGNLDGRVKGAVQEAGFTFGIATDTGGLRVSEDPHQIFRVSMFPEDGPMQLWKKTSSWYRGYYRWKRGK